ncbi:MAG: dTDP-4-dehydrorhamnose 3,5-epimerase [Candidatus Shapirobacteria bacterium]|jgi:dTDP-4-dehydrorhamnose 3,5-epimerase|nr:dTDP-4-dehydrorhamnose 3,5-epimerase [Candidatus Shapirobacteria bacterium]
MPYEQISETDLKGVFKIQPKVFTDARGYYSPTLVVSEFEEATRINFNLIQIATSFNSEKGVFRGLHYQASPYTQGKLVMATEGSVLDIVLDIRKNSSTFGKHITEILTAKKQNQLWIPPGFAHGYLALENNTRFTYFVTDGVYSPQNEKGVNIFDPMLEIDLPLSNSEIKLSDKDQLLPSLSNIAKEDLL